MKTVKSEPNQLRASSFTHRVWYQYFPTANIWTSANMKNLLMTSAHYLKAMQKIPTYCVCSPFCSCCCKRLNLTHRDCHHP